MTTHANKLAAALAVVANDVSDLCPATMDQVNSALEAHNARTFANDCHEMADRCTDILRNDDAQRRAGAYERLRDADRTAVARLRAYAHGVGDEAECAPEAFKESREDTPAMLPLEAACLGLAERLERIRTMNDEPPHRSLALSVTERELRSLARTWSK